MNEQTNTESTESLETVAFQRTPFEKYSRHAGGLIDSVTHQFNEDGSVNWRAMIKPEFIYPNKDFFEVRKLAVPDSIEGLEDKQLSIMLGGLKELAKLRGFKSVEYDVQQVGESYVTAKCRIKWIGNYETNYESVVYEDIGNATKDNTDSFCLKFLETIACNRAFVRCVRNFLNIHIVGADEVDKSKNKVVDLSELRVSDATPITPQGILEKAVNEKLGHQSFDEFKPFLREVYREAAADGNKEIVDQLSEAKKWASFKDIPAKTSRVLLKMINERKKDN